LRNADFGLRIGSIKLLFNPQSAFRKAVYAEVAAAGSWYYGTVTLQDVVSLLGRSGSGSGVDLEITTTAASGF